MKKPRPAGSGRRLAARPHKALTCTRSARMTTEPYYISESDQISFEKCSARAKSEVTQLIRN